MARAICMQYPGAVHLVMARGNHGQSVFGDDTDRKVFLETLGEACQKTGWRLHAYVDGGQLARMARSAPEKMVLAWWLRQRNPVSLRWLSERLAMGHYTRVSQAIGVVQRCPNRFHKRVQRRLKKVWSEEKCGP